MVEPMEEDESQWRHNPSWWNIFFTRLRHLERRVSNLEQAESDLSAAVDAVATEVQNLQAAIASGDQAAQQAAADAIEAQVTRLQGVASGGATPAPAPAPAPAPTPDPAPAPAPAPDQPSGPTTP